MEKSPDENPPGFFQAVEATDTASTHPIPYFRMAAGGDVEFHFDNLLSIHHSCLPSVSTFPPFPAARLGRREEPNASKVASAANAF